MNGVLHPRTSPYQGLIPYTEEDAQFFFGREKDIRLITANLFASPLTILYGPSGVGKSSVLRAGVVTQLSRRDDLALIYISDWKAEPLEQLKTMLASLPNLTPAPDKSQPLSELLSECVSRLDTRLMILLDQFEEYFLYHPVEDVFTIQFSRAVMQTDAPASFLISIREDGLAKLDRFEGRIPILFDNYLRLEHLDDTAARAAIEKPIDKYNELFLMGKTGMQIEPALVTEVLRELKSGQVSLKGIGHGTLDQGSPRTVETPYLQLVMTRLWQAEIELGSRLLRLTTLKSLGGAEKIVRTHMDGVLKKLTRPQRFLASRILQYLVTPSGSKIALGPNDLASYAEAPPRQVGTLLHRLTQPDIRLLRAVQTPGKAEVRYEIFHDVLALPILNWRANQVRKSRIWLILLAAVLVIIACSYGLLTFLPYTLGKSENLVIETSAAILLGICTAIICLVPMLIGFFIGRSWSRAR